MECLPLVMEPESRMYAHPVVVLDFQSLYPSQVGAMHWHVALCTWRGPGIVHDGAAPTTAVTDCARACVLVSRIAVRAYQHPGAAFTCISPTPLAPWAADHRLQSVLQHLHRAAAARQGR